MRITATLGAIALSMAAASAANAAITLDASDINDTQTINFSGMAGTPVVPVPELMASLDLTLTSIVGNDWFFNYGVSNDSSITARLAGFGFNTDPQLSGATVTGTYNIAGSGNVPIFGAVDVCFKDGGGTNNCAGGGSGGIFDGLTGGGTLKLSFSAPTQSLTLDNFVVRFQSIDTRYVESGSGIGIETAVPEPGTWMMMLLGFGIVGGMMRRRKDAEPRVRYA